MLPVSLAAPHLANSFPPMQLNGKADNVIIIVFDAFSASNTFLHGYPRETTPNISKLSEKAIVYHNHYAGGNFTTPGTATVLTGAHPWTHRAFRRNGTVEDAFAKKNIFSAFDGYHRIAYSHNPWVYTLLNQFQEDIEKIIPLDEFLLLKKDFVAKLLENDDNIATVSRVRIVDRKAEGFSYSLFLSYLYGAFERYRASQIKEWKTVYPRGIPSMDYINYFLLEDALDGLENYLNNIQQPFLGYFHYWPPHEPYRTRKDFYNRFKNDNYKPVEKPRNPFSYGRTQKDPLRLSRLRIEYDEYILYADQEFARFFERLENSGLLENTWLILTSDHGELFERGIEGHSTPVLYQPLIHIPLLIFEPGRTKRKDIYSPTSAIDVLPTLLQVTGQNPAPWSEGIILPPFSNSISSQERNLYTLEARASEQFKPLTTATVTMHKENYKLIYYLGHEEFGETGEHVELYNILNDPEELNNLYSTKQELSQILLHELKEKLTQVNKPYE